MGRIYDLFISKYNYTDFHELNLDWLIAAVKQFEYEMENFVAINAVKYADPIQWDITRQYEKNTIVIDPITGTAYISAKAVPMGVALSREDYWNVVFDLGRFITLSAQNFANTYEALPTTTATMETPKDGWIVWNTTLYKALNDIHIGDMYVVEGNIEKKTVEDFFNTEVQTRAEEDTRIELSLTDLINSKVGVEAQTRADEDARIELALTDLINSKVGVEAQTRADEDVRIELNLRDLIASEVRTRANEDLRIENFFSGEIGDLANLDTIFKDNLVGAVNEVNGKLSGLYDKADIRNYGGVADGQTDCTQAFRDCMTDNNMVYLPNYNNTAYILGAINIGSGQSIIGTEGTTINTVAPTLFTIAGQNVDIRNLVINTQNNVFLIDSTSSNWSFIHIENVYSYGANVFLSDVADAPYSYTNLYVNRCACRLHHGNGFIIKKCYAFLIMQDVTVDSISVVGQAPMFFIENNFGAHLIRCEAEGGYSDGTHTSHAGFYISNSQALWLERCMADTVDSVGFNIINSQYVYFNSCVSSLNGSHGIALVGTTTQHILINNCLLNGRITLGGPVSANGIYNYAECVNISNCNIQNFTGYAIGSVAQGNETLITNCSMYSCNHSLLISSGGGVISNCRSAIADTPVFGSMYHRNCLFYGTLYDSPLGS